MRCTTSGVNGLARLLTYPWRIDSMAIARNDIGASPVALGEVAGSTDFHEMSFG